MFISRGAFFSVSAVQVNGSSINHERSESSCKAHSFCLLFSDLYELLAHQSCDRHQSLLCSNLNKVNWVLKEKNLSSERHKIELLLRWSWVLRLLDRCEAFSSWVMLSKLLGISSSSSGFGDSFVDDPNKFILSINSLMIYKMTQPRRFWKFINMEVSLSIDPTKSPQLQSRRRCLHRDSESSASAPTINMSKTTNFVREVSFAWSIKISEVFSVPALPARPLIGVNML